MRCCGAAAQEAAGTCGISLEKLRDMVPRLARIRNKTHLHIDRKALDNPAQIWSNAGIEADDIAHALRNAALLLARIKHGIYGGKMEALTPYDGADVKRIVSAYVAACRNA